ncbi:hypothetical protein PAP_00465 [Palaeococcus pacificus DY20341]|uniref:TIGR00153 family protein n=1 Tax=Palaeococcus pacificus DY20341 TaxID=1343739 RepID=A0A075LPB4_9EURY|nr:TIGR00153 family protein [Palaeococcus pacificus]AIF68540.1 hypothetical protein PAP_00465 [Palaeococcus pacificus DY20341]
MGLFGGKENNVFEVLHDHLKAVEKTLEKFKELVEAYLDEDLEKAESLVKEVELFEREADGLRRGIETMLYRGAFLPVNRGDYARLVERIDNVADAAESASHILILAKPKVPKELADEIVRVVQASLETYRMLEESVVFLDRDVDKALEYTKKTEELEEESDKYEHDLLGKIFESEEISTYAKLIWDQIITKIGDIADRAEDASDQVMLIAIKRRG